MKITKSFTLAFKSIISNKMRSFLTMLGIIIGIAAVITIVSLMNGLTNRVTEMFKELGTTNINVIIMGRGSTRSYRADDMYKFVKNNPELIAAVSPNVLVSGSVKAQNSTEAVSTTIAGVGESYNKIQNMTFSQGEFFTYIDVDRMENVCVIGSYLKQKLFGFSSALGQVIKINGIPYTVIGAIEEKAGSRERSADDCVYIPYTNATKINNNANISSYVVSAASEDLVDPAMDAITAELVRVFGSTDYFRVQGMKELLDSFSDMTAMLTLGLVLIAGISLLVGGIGIMNIMLVSVTERTKEIGIRKSLGARRSNILSQFIIEAAVVSCVGGIIGIIIGAIMAGIAGKFMDIKVVPSLYAIAVAVSVSVGIGITFGFLPANKAARLNPIDALRFE